MTAVTLYLASASPRRREILNLLGIPHQVLPQDIDECRLPGEEPTAFVCRLAKAKAQAALSGLPDQHSGACLGSDTTVVCDSVIYEKPVDEADACSILRSLSGRTHQVLTAVALATFEKTEVLLSESQVTFRPLSEAEIKAYWASGEPADKAGAYGIQGLGGIFISDIKGSYSGIMGLPVMETSMLLDGIGITPELILGGKV